MALAKSYWLLSSVVISISTPLVVGAAAAASPLAYPTARRSDLVEDHHGIKVADPYRWMEELDSPETREWVLAEAKLTDAYLEKIPDRLNLRRRLTELLNYEKFGVPFQRGDRYFYTHNTGLQPHSILYTTQGLKGKPTVALDPNRLGTNGAVGVAGYVASLDGAILAYGASQGGSDWTDWHFRDVVTGKDLPDVVRWTKYYHPVFASDGKGVYYSAFPAPKPGEELRARDLGNVVFYHAFGTAPSADRKIYDRPDHPDWQFEPHAIALKRWLVLTAGEGQVGDKGLENVYAVDLRSTDGKTVVPLSAGFDAGYLYVGATRGRLYFQSSLDAPRGRVLSIDPVAAARRPAGSAPDKSLWKEVVPQESDAMDFTAASVNLAGDRLIVRTMHDAHTRVAIYGLDGNLQRELRLPGNGTASGFGGAGEKEKSVFYSYSDYVTPPTIFRLNLADGTSTVFRAPKVPFDTSTLAMEQVFFSAKDGTRIPMYIVHRKGIKLDGTNPTLLYGYGGFGISMMPRFDASRVAWFERGGVFAVANIRGGGEYGEEWHRQAIRSKKQIVFDDFISAAEWLIAKGYTSTPHLAIEGGSNGGLLVGACMTQRPDLFGAVLAYVGVMDMLRFDRFGQGAGWIGDYGSPSDPEDFKALYAYSPCHNVKAGTRYPATFVVTGDHDARVMPAHSFKFAAALQGAQAGPAPVLLRVRLDTGHGSGPTTGQQIAEKADAYAFLIENLTDRPTP